MINPLQCLIAVSFAHAVRPSIRARENTKIVREGSNVNIACELQGNPSPNVTWTDQTTGQVIQIRPRSTVTRRVIYNANCLNTTTYRITATNNRGSDTSYVTLNITCKLYVRIRHYIQHVSYKGSDTSYVTLSVCQFTQCPSTRFSELFSAVLWDIDLEFGI